MRLYHKMKCRCGDNKEGCGCIKYVVLDLDETLINTSDSQGGNALSKLGLKNKKNIRLRDRVYSLDMVDFLTPGEGKEVRYVGIFRPHVREFIRFCLRYFDEVVVWSAGLNRYVKELCRKLFPAGVKQPLLVYTQTDCVMRRSDGIIFKPLDKLYRDPRTQGKMNAKNTLIIDDNYQTFSQNEENAIHIPKYTAPLTQKELRSHEDDRLVKIMEWLATEEVLKSKDVRKLDKSTIFDE